jgi:periplasmic protein CpxP/Spy
VKQWISYGVLLAAAPMAAQPISAARAPLPPPAGSFAAPLSAPPLPGDAAAGMASTPSASAEAALDQRIGMLRQLLAITTAQLPLWEAVAHAMREDAQSTDAMFAQRAAAVASMSAVDNMDSYARIVRTYAASTERLAHAFYRLYVGLSPAQRQVADEFFRRPAGMPARR